MFAPLIEKNQLTVSHKLSMPLLFDPLQVYVYLKKNET